MTKGKGPWLIGARYKTYNATTDTFVGKGMIKYRCNSPYDGRR